MTETAFAAIGSIGAGLMGIEPDAPRSTIGTLPRLPKNLEWVRLANLPVAANQISVEHRGNAETRFTNQAGDAIVWKAAILRSSLQRRRGNLRRRGRGPQTGSGTSPQWPSRDLCRRAGACRSDADRQTGGVTLWGGQC
ncbi:MAG TPA: hypothetical protein VMH81_35685 [Bryobacteraceae bacterium]|nr:hypothetical protein [Bryobacteraceae bacterium]